MSLLNEKCVGFVERGSVTMSSILAIFFFIIALVVTQHSVYTLFIISSIATITLLKKNIILSFLFFNIGIAASNNITLGGLFICILTLVALALNANSRRISLSIRESCSLLLLLFYIILTLFYSFFIEIDSLYVDYFKRNIYKEFIFPLVIILCLVFYRSNGVDYLLATFYTSCFLALTQLISLFFKFEVSFYIGAQFSLALIVLLLLKNNYLKLLAAINVCVYLIIFIRGDVYFSSQDVMLVLLVLFLHMLLFQRLFLCAFLLLFSIIGIMGKSIDVHLFLKEILGLESAYAFKLGQVFLVLQSASFSDIPWSPRVRLVEIVNTFDRSIFEIIFGSGLVSFIKVDFMSFIQNSYDVLGADDFHSSEISSERFYGLHNTSRGLLHYGLIYFVCTTYFFLTNLFRTSQSDKMEIKKVANLYFYVLAIWNPNMLFVYLLATLKNNGNRNAF